MSMTMDIVKQNSDLEIDDTQIELAAVHIPGHSGTIPTEGIDMTVPMNTMDPNNNHNMSLPILNPGDHSNTASVVPIAIPGPYPMLHQHSDPQSQPISQPQMSGPSPVMMYGPKTSLIQQAKSDGDLYIKDLNTRQKTKVNDINDEDAP